MGETRKSIILLLWIIGSPVSVVYLSNKLHLTCREFTGGRRISIFRNYFAQLCIILTATCLNTVAEDETYFIIQVYSYNYFISQGQGWNTEQFLLSNCENTEYISQHWFYCLVLRACGNPFCELFLSTPVQYFLQIFRMKKC